MRQWLEETALPLFSAGMLLGIAFGFSFVIEWVLVRVGQAIPYTTILIVLLALMVVLYQPKLKLQKKDEKPHS